MDSLVCFNLCRSPNFLFCVEPDEQVDTNDLTTSHVIVDRTQCVNNSSCYVSGIAYSDVLPGLTNANASTILNANNYTEMCGYISSNNIQTCLNCSNP